MCVSAEVQPEMPDIFRRVDSLRLRAQNGFGNGRIMLALRALTMMRLKRAGTTG